MHAMRKTCFSLAHRVLDMCLTAESRILGCHQIRQTRLLLCNQTCLGSYAMGRSSVKRSPNYGPYYRLLSLNCNAIVTARVIGSAWYLSKSQPHLVDGNSVLCTLNARELYTTSVINNKEKNTQQNADISQKDASGEQETDLGKAWREDVILTIPNALTISRIALAPVLGYMVIQQHYLLACGMFAYAGITDLLDGYIARRFPSQASSFGSYLDPLADKLLVSTLFITLTAVHLIPVVLTALVIVRDVLLIGAAFYVRYISLPPPKTVRRYFDVTHATAQLQPTSISKFNTVVQLSLVAATLAAPVLGYVDHEALVYLWYLTAGTTVASGLSYVYAKNTFRILRETKKRRKAKEHQG